MQFVDEEDDVAALADLGDELLDAFLELAAVLRAGDHAGEAEGDKALVHELVRNVALDDAVREALGDGRLADTRVAYQHGVVLGAAQQDLDGAVHLNLAADDGVQVAGAGGVGEVAAVLGQHAAGLAATSAPSPTSAATSAAARRAGLVGGFDAAAERAELDSGRGQGSRGQTTGVGERAEQQVLGADEADAHAFGFQGGGAQHVAALRREWAAALVPRVAGGQGVDDGLAQRIQFDAGIAQNTRSGGLRRLQDGEQDVAGTDGVVAEAGGLKLGVLEHAAPAAGEAADVLDRGVFVGFAFHGD